VLTLTYIAFIFLAAIIGAGFGFAGHFARAHFTYSPEQVFDGGLASDITNDMLSSHDLTFEKHVVGAEWDDNGFWDADSNRNLIYYMTSGFAAPIIIGIMFWHERATLVKGACDGLLSIGIHSPLC
jgi:hypothetical protein